MFLEVVDSFLVARWRSRVAEKALHSCTCVYFDGSFLLPVNTTIPLSILGGDSAVPGCTGCVTKSNKGCSLVAYDVVGLTTSPFYLVNSINCFKLTQSHHIIHLHNVAAICRPLLV